MITGTGLTAIALMTFYYFIPFFIVRGAPDSIGMLRPFLVLGSVLVIFVGFYWVRRSRQSLPAASAISISVLCLSAVTVLIMILFPQAIANILANH